jgi:hypothetical protein
MKRNLITALLILVGFVAMAQTPQKFNYQAVARDKNGQPLANQQVAIEIIIKQNNNAVFTEKQTTQTNDFGLITLEIGGKSPLSTINWSQGTFNMDVRIDPNGGSNFELLGTIQLLAVPYALYADRANERQRLKLDNNKLSIVDSGGASEVTLPTSGTGSGDNWGTQTVATTPILSGKGTSADPLSIAPQGAVNGQFLKWNGTTWIPGTVNASGDGWGTQTVTTTPILSGKGTSADPLSIAPQGAVNGQVLQWNGTTWVPSTINASGGDGWGSQVAKTNTATITGDGSATNPLNLANNAVTSDKIVDGGIQGVDINQMNATDGQVLKWLNNSWQPANDNASGTGGAANYSGINGINVNNTTTVISLNPLSIAGNNLSIQGQSTNVDLSKYLDNTDAQTLRLNGNELSITNGNFVILPTGTGSTTVTTNATLSGNGTVGDPLSIAPQGAFSGQVLKWNGTTWQPANDAVGTGTGGTTYTAGTGIFIDAQNRINNTGDTNAADDITTSSSATGDVSGTFSTLSVNRLQGRTISSATPTIGQVLKWNGTSWSPSTDDTGTSGTTYIAGTGISIDAQNRISNTGVTSTNVGNDLSGTLPNPSVIGLRSIPISSTLPNTAGQVLTYNGSQWIPQTPSTGGTSDWTQYSISRPGGTETGIYSNRSVIKVGSQSSDVKLYPNSISIIGDCPAGAVCTQSSWTTISNGYIDVTNDVTSSPVANFGGNVVARSLNVGNITSTGNIGATGNATVGGTANVTGNATVGGNATVTGSLNVRSKVDIGTGMQGNGSITLYNNSNIGMIRISGTGAAGNGAVSILDASGNPGKAYMQLNGSQGEIFANSITKNGGTFKIDHPQDPANKYLYHSFVESPDMMNIYNGNIKTDVNGDALVPLPSYFEAENIDFKYQLTVIGQFAQAIVWEKIKDNQFKIKTDKPNVEVSWQVTGVRNDVWAQKYRVIPEVDKENENKGKYMNPELFGESSDKSIRPVNIENHDLPKESKRNKAVVEKTDEKLKNTEGVKN